MKNNEEGLIEFLKGISEHKGYWTVEHRGINFKNEAGYVPEGLYEYADASSAGDIIDYLCAPGSTEGNTVLYVVNCDLDKGLVREVLTATARMGQDYQDAIVFLTASKERYEEIKGALQEVPLTDADAVFLIDTGKIRV